MRRIRSVVAVVAVFVAGCAGPRVPLDVGVKEYPSDVIIGAAGDEPVALRPAVRPPARRRSLPRIRPDAPPTVRTEELCPDADPLGNPAVEAPRGIPKPPVEGTYYFRNEGTYEAESLGLKGKFPPVSRRTVDNVEMNGPIFTFDVLDELLSIKTSYMIDPADGGGLFMTRFEQKQPQGTWIFEPTPSIKLLPFPLENGATWDSVGTDVGTTMIVHGVVGAYRDEDHDGKPDDADENGIPDDPVPKTRVDACGRWLDAWAVRITGPDGEGPAKIVGPTTATNFDYTATYAFGTQFGGLSIQDTVAYHGTSGGVEQHVENTAVIATPPEMPK